MFDSPINQRTINAKFKRIELCDLLLACTAVSSSLKESGETAVKWDLLHDHIMQIIDDFDKKKYGG